MGTDRRGQRRGGFYWEGDKPYASVTTILNSTIRKTPLEYWQKQQVYFAMVKDPTLEESKAMAAPYAVSEIAKNRGTTVHSIVEAYKIKGKIKVAKEYEGYAEAFDTFMKESGAEIMEHEKTVISDKYQYAGTLDLLLKIKGKLIIGDVKTGKDIYDDAFLQLSAYHEAMSEMGVESERVLVILLRPTGVYMARYEIPNVKPFLVVKEVLGVDEQKEINQIKLLGRR